MTVPANALTASFTATAGTFTTTQTATLSATLGSTSATATLMLTTGSTALGTRFWLSGNPAETTGVTNGATIKPAVAPSTLKATVVVNGSGSVKFASAGGVYFQNCCANTNNAYFKFSGAALSELFNAPAGQISFTVTSRYSFAQRQATAGTKRYVFDARDATDHQAYFLTQILSGTLQFAYMIDGAPQYYNVPKGSEDRLFGNGVALDVLLKWDGSTISLFLNGTLAKSTPYIAASQNWTAASIFDVGAYEYQTFGGYNVSDEPISNFTVTNPTVLQISGTSTEVSGLKDGATVTPSIAPPGVAGNVVLNGTGSVHFVTAGVYFLNCCTNDNNAFFRFTGPALNNVFSLPRGQILFTLQSRYSFAQRQTSAALPRYAFDVVDSVNKNSFYFATQVTSTGLQFAYMIAGTPTYYFVPKGTEDKLFGSGVRLNVMLQWDGTAIRLFLNGVAVKTTAYVPRPTSAQSNYVFNLGANEYQTSGGYNALDDMIRNFAVTRVDVTSPTAALSPKTVAAPLPQTISALPSSVIQSPLASADTAASLSCPAVATAGSNVICEVAGIAPQPTEIQIASDSADLRVPGLLATQAGETKLRFEAAIAFDAPAGRVVLEGRSGESMIRQSVDVVRSAAPVLIAPRRQTGRPGSAVRFDVFTDDQSATALSASGLPAGATFDTTTGAFAWTPAETDLGSYTVTVTAANSLGVTASQTVELNVTAETADPPEILTLGDEGDQALAVHAGSSTLVSLPGVRFYGQPARAGDFLSLSVSGIDCAPAGAANLRVKIGAEYAAVMALQPIDGTTGVCLLTIETPAGLAGPRVPVSLEVVAPSGAVTSSNIASIATEY